MIKPNSQDIADKTGSCNYATFLKHSPALFLLCYFDILPLQHALHNAL